METLGLVAAACRRAPLIGAVAVAAACGGSGGDGDSLPAVDGPTAPRLDVTATDMAYDPAEIAVAAGEVEVVLRNDGATLHDLRIEEQPFIVEAVGGETASGRLLLDAGRYRFFCSLPGHRVAGMEGVVEVR
jgi:uncharacterized cupredoxin-like copper-binding protein